jgi:hypothetical protein
MNNMRLSKAIWCGIVACALSFTFVAGGQQARADDQPGVARISVVDGGVHLKRGDSGDTVSAAMNAPVSVGDYVTTDSGGRAEVQFDNSNLLRVDSNTQLRFTKLDPDDHSLQLAQGTVEMRVFDVNGANPSVETPSVTVRPDQSGQYLVEVTPDGDSRITVRTGLVDVIDDQGTRQLGPGQTMVCTGDPSHVSFSFVGEVAYDDFNHWADGLDARVSTTGEPSYVAQQYPGADDLNQYGQWQNDPDYGQVWVPNVAPDWAPYTAGQWAYEPYYGWTWISYEPWGWAPYHYGHWFYSVAYGWAWYPGPEFVAPVYAPAMVAFFTCGDGVSLSFGIGDDIGWYPIGPGAPFSPWWGYGRSVSIVNITNVYNITNIYNNGWHRPWWVVSGRDWHNGNFGHHIPIPIDPGHISHYHPVTGPIPVAPGPRNLVVARDGQIASGRPVSSRFGDFKSAPAPIASFHDEVAKFDSFARQQRTAFAGRPEAPGDRPVTTQPVARGDVHPQVSQDGTGFGRPASSPWNRFAAAQPHAVADMPRTDAGAPRLGDGSGTRPIADQRGPGSAPAGDPWGRFSSEGERPSTVHSLPSQINRPSGPSGFNRFSNQPSRPASGPQQFSRPEPSSRPAGNERPAQGGGPWNRFSSSDERPTQAGSYSRPSTFGGGSAYRPEYGSSSRPDYGGSSYRPAYGSSSRPSYGSAYRPDYGSSYRPSYGGSTNRPSYGNGYSSRPRYSQGGGYSRPSGTRPSAGGRPKTNSPH